MMRGQDSFQYLELRQMPWVEGAGVVAIINIQMGCFGSSGDIKNNSIQHQKVSKVEEVDVIKSKLKVTRDRISNITSQYHKELSSIEKELDKEKASGLKNKPKAVYLLKQRKDFQEQISNLEARNKTVTNTLHMLAQQQLDQQMVNVLQQSNQYMRQVEEELERNNWREVLAEANENKYNSIDFRQAEEDPEVDKLYAELEQQLSRDKSGGFQQPVKAKGVIAEMREQVQEQHQEGEHPAQHN